MICYTILVSFCLLGVASAKVSACLSRDNNLIVDCKLYPVPKATKCTYTTQGKVVACSDDKVQQDVSFKKKATAKLEKDICRLILGGFEEENVKQLNCTIEGAKVLSEEIHLEKSKLATCAACSFLLHDGLTLLLAVFTPLLSVLL